MKRGKEMDLQKVLTEHKKWLDGNGGKCMDLHDTYLHGADLRNEDLRYANLSGTDLRNTDLRGANLYNADLHSADLRGASLYNINLSYTNLSYVNLSYVNLYLTNLSYANLSYANLSYANLSYADLHSADLYCANLENINLNGTTLHFTNLSGAKNLFNSIDFMEKNFKKSKDGYIAYKCFDGSYSKNNTWKISSGSIINENVNPNRTDECGCGINVAPLQWVQCNYPNKKIWRVLIRWEWLCGVCVPYNTDGKIRCERVELIDIVENKTKED